jgi:hypothetical protein
VEDEMECREERGKDEVESGGGGRAEERRKMRIR